MSMQKMKESVEIIQRMKENGIFKYYIEYIDFPFYKNLVERSRINFKFPLTVLIGKNGGGKSSTLHALFGAPYGYTCSDFWFSTEVDPIAESGDRNRYFYGYKEDRNSEIKEVMKTRMKRGSETKKEDPDYWETSRPIKSDGMIDSKRHAPVNKKVIYMDFRAEVSAFDKIFHFSKEDLEARKNLLRGRSKYLKRLFNNQDMRFPGLPDNMVGKMEILSEEITKKVGEILNKEYEEIKVAEHRLFKNYGTSVYLKNKFATGYSEANAGSGEIAVVQLIRQIEKAPEYALILLDEPEVSLHPGAQENLKNYLLDVIKRKKVQIVISSHSPTLIEGLPMSAIKLYKTNELGKFYIREDVHYKEAFFDIENRIKDKKQIYCEDYAAKKLIEKTLAYMGKEKHFEVVYFHGGEKTLVNHYMTSIALNRHLSDRIFFILDGDMDNGYVFKETNLTVQEIQNEEYLKELVKKAYGMELEVHPDGGRGGGRRDQKCEEYLQYLRYYTSNVFYLPAQMIPEEIILYSEFAKERYRHILEKYDSINSENAKDIIQEIVEDEHDDDECIHEYINNLISILANKWSKENSVLRNMLVKILNEIFEK